MSPSGSEASRVAPLSPAGPDPPALASESPSLASPPCERSRPDLPWPFALPFPFPPALATRSGTAAPSGPAGAAKSCAVCVAMGIASTADAIPSQKAPAATRPIVRFGTCFMEILLGCRRNLARRCPPAAGSDPLTAIRPGRWRRYSGDPELCPMRGWRGGSCAALNRAPGHVYVSIGSKPPTLTNDIAQIQRVGKLLALPQPLRA